MAGVIMLGFEGSSLAMEARERVEGPERREAREGREEWRGEEGGEVMDVCLMDWRGDMAMLNCGIVSRWIQRRGDGKIDYALLHFD